MKRGYLKIFLGYAAGVGKTYRMLSEAHRRIGRGEDVVIGFLEPHKRTETIAMAEGLEVVPTKKIEYRGSVIEEMDTAAVIARNPKWVLVDELAHTNAPGSVHEKRWQSVEELLDNGISVLTTVNVQHIESQNDIVKQITNITVNETVPDKIIENADEIVVVDIAPQSLQNRLRRGVIYPKDAIDPALNNFFRSGNLTALRELALRTLTEEVDDDLQKFFSNHVVDKTWGASERILVTVTPRKASKKLIRRGYRISQRLGAEMWVLHVRAPGVALPPEDEAMLEKLRELTMELGGSFVDQPADDVGREIIDFIHKHQISMMVMGQSDQSRRHEIFRGSIVNRIMRETRNTDVVIVAHPDERASEGDSPT